MKRTIRARWTAALVALGLGMLWWAPVRAAVPLPQFGKQHYACRQASKVVVDGKLDEPDWSRAEAIRMITGEFETTMRFLHDPKHLYWGVHCRSVRPGDIVVEYKQNGDKVWRDDCMELFLDARHKHQHYYQFCINADGYACVLHSSDKGRWHAPTITARTAILKDCWVLEAAIPWGEFGGGPATGRSIALAAARHIREQGGKRYVPWGHPRKGAQNPHLIVVNPANTKAFARRFGKLARRVRRSGDELRRTVKTIRLDEQTRRQLQAALTTADRAAQACDRRVQDFSLTDRAVLARLETDLLQSLRTLNDLRGIVRFVPFFDPPTTQR